VSSYFIAQIKIHDPDEYGKYLGGFDEVFARYNGEVIAVDDSPAVLEGEWSYTRVVVIRFPDEDEARRWYDSAEYQSLAQHRFSAASADILLAKGRR
jgi:uncharacterized protein (DUF1330 family)